MRSSTRVASLLRTPEVAIVLGLALLFVMAIAAIPSVFFLRNFSYDPIRYYLMAEHIAATGSPTTSYAVDEAPFIYASGASYFYAPIFMTFETFALRLKAIQAANIVLLGIFVFFAFRYFKRAIPEFAKTGLFFGFAGAILVDEYWQRAIFQPNADLIPAIATISASFIACDAKWARWKKALILTFIGLIGLQVKLSLAMFPITYLAVELVREPSPRRRRYYMAAVAAAIALLVIIAAANWTTVHFYIEALLRRSYSPILGVDTATMLDHLRIDAETLWFLAIPTTLIPNLRFQYQHSDVPDFMGFKGDYFSPAAVLWLAITTVISICIVIGATKLFRKRPFDVVLMACCVAVFAFVPNSTRRYLMPFQPCIWVCALTVAAPLWREHLKPNISKKWLFAAAAVMIAASQFRVIELRSHIARGNSGLSQIQFIRQVSDVHQRMIAFLTEQPRASTRLLYQPYNDELVLGTRWNIWGAASGLPAYSWAAVFPIWTAGKQVLITMSCSRPTCFTFAKTKQMVVKNALARCFALKPLRHWQNDSAIAEVLRLEPIPGCHITPATEI